MLGAVRMHSDAAANAGLLILMQYKLIIIA